MEHIFKDLLRLEEVRIHYGNAGVQLIQVVLEGCTCK